ncbi:hypothetical protein BBJ28_00025229 [Nothophytophthora sp. Chile5]|nr:hypothetical protein BBJ28_00025229 [Nothophytophthora sp. Chile5]
MPNLNVTSNVASAGVDKPAALAALSKAVATALGKSEQVVMVHLNLDTPMLFQASDATVSLLTETVSSALNIPKDRIFMNLDDVPRSNWAKGGVLIPEPKQ